MGESLEEYRHAPPPPPSTKPDSAPEPSVPFHHCLAWHGCRCPLPPLPGPHGNWASTTMVCWGGNPIPRSIKRNVGLEPALLLHCYLAQCGSQDAVPLPPSPAQLPVCCSADAGPEVGAFSSLVLILLFRGFKLPSGFFF